MLLLLNSDSSESESSSTDTSDSSDSDSDAKACAYEREFNKLFRIPAKRPKVVGFIEDVVRQYSDHEVCGQQNLHARLGKPFRHVRKHRVQSSSRVAQFLMTLGPSVIKFPADLEKLTSSFEKVSGMPAVIGCIDESYVKIQCPAYKVASTYCNRHHYLSLTLLVICDHKRRFLDAFTGTSSKMHDSRVFSLSPLSKNIASVCQGRYHILGDAAYPLREYLSTPYRDYGAMNKQQKGFNFKFSGTRVLIENAFRTLKKRFRQLMYLELHTIHWLNEFIISCCILHNLCIDYGDEEPDDDNNDDGAPNAIQWENCTDNHSDKTDEDSFTSRLCCHHTSRHSTVCPYASVAQRAQPWRRRSDAAAAVSPHRGHGGHSSSGSRRRHAPSSSSSAACPCSSSSPDGVVVEAAAPRCYSSPAAAETGCGVSLHSAVVCSCSLSPAPPAPRPLRTPAPCYSLPPTVLCHRTRVKELQCLSPCLCSPVVTVAASMAAAASASASSVARSVLALLKTVARDVLAVLAVVAFFLTPVAALPYTRAYVPNTYTLINSNCSAWALRILTWLLLLPGTVSVVFVLIVLPPLCIPRRWKYRAVIENYKVGPQTTFRWESPFFDRKYRL
nr:uncharacterized protein LOC119183526 [Rhipicephalus microplus]